jgi:trehalose 6-phosphate synthase
MRMSLRLILSIIVGTMLVSFIFADAQVQAQKRSLRNDLERRAQLLAESLEESIGPLLQHYPLNNPLNKLWTLVERFGNRERLAGVAIYDQRGKPLAMTSGLAGKIPAPPTAVTQAIASNQGTGEFIGQGSALVHVYALPLERDGVATGALAIFHDAGYIQAQSARIWRQTFLTVLAQALLIALVTLLIVRWSIVGPIARTAQWMRELRTHSVFRTPELPEEDLFKPLVHEVTHLTKSLASARAAAEEEARLREASESVWTAERLRIHVKSRLADGPLLVVSNR